MHWTQTPNGKKRLKEIKMKRANKEAIKNGEKPPFLVPSEELSILPSKIQQIEQKSVPEIWQLIENLEHEIQEQQTILAYLKSQVKE